MISKRLLIFLSLFTVGFMVFKSFDTNSSKQDTTALEIHEDQNLRTHQITYTEKNRKFSKPMSLQRYKKAMIKNNLHDKLTAAKNKSLSPKNRKVIPNKKKTKKVAKKKKKDEKKKVKQAKKDDQTEVKSASTQEPSFGKASKVSKAHSTMNVTTLVGAVQPASGVDANIVDENSIETDQTAVDSREGSGLKQGLDKNIDSFAIFTAGYFKKLLSEENLIEFEQALQTPGISVDQVAVAYHEVLNQLFSVEKESERFFQYDGFIRTQFLNSHAFAPALAKSFSLSNFSEEKIDYTTALINQLALTWTAEYGTSGEFSNIYESDVLARIPQNMLGHPSIIGLFESIGRLSMDLLSDSNVEV